MLAGFAFFTESVDNEYSIEPIHKEISNLIKLLFLDKFFRIL